MVYDVIELIDDRECVTPMPMISPVVDPYGYDFAGLPNIPVKLEILSETFFQ
jgi:hypothetical protein